MKKIFATLVAMASLCHAATAQSVLDATLKNCNTVSITATNTGSLKDDSHMYFSYWIEKQNSPGIWELYEKKTTNISPITFENLPVGNYRAAHTLDIHEEIYYNPQDEANNNRTGSTYFTITNCLEDRGVSGNIISENTIQLFPNPASDVLNLVLSGIDLKEEVYLNLTDITGRDVFAQKVSSQSQGIDITSLNSGSYIATLSVSGKQVFQKLIIVQK